ncbi:hypothetical protein CBR_g8910 [Chara braunii]|uniref:Cation efflux protein transmembrane domain-containing protein n=1 Tax=Chara braunii TaxID=69332 RepID=A0A388KN58_CHABU|nr:hypothetical protein CBR_g8910 [Chara braunii]|eukprot:GBG71494.1 hypothetical protein CBR_g8910 [Chara braunii]
MLAKALANRMATVLENIIHLAQTGFMTNRNIQENILLVNEVLGALAMVFAFYLIFKGPTLFSQSGFLTGALNGEEDIAAEDINLSTAGIAIAAGILGALRRVVARRTAVKAHAKKRLHALTVAAATCFVFPFASWQLFSEWDGFVQGASTGSAVVAYGMFIIFGIVLSFYVDTFAEDKLQINVSSVKHVAITTVLLLMMELAQGGHPTVISLFVGGGALAVGMHLAGATERRRESRSLIGDLPGKEWQQSVHTSMLPPAFQGPLAHVMADSKSRRIAFFLMINTSFMVVEFIYGFWSNSLGLISDACHMLFDCAALAIGLYASYMMRLPATPKYTYGYGRFEVLSGYVNAVFLVFVAALIVLESIERILDPPDISTDNLLLVCIGGLLVNVVGLIFFHEAHSHAHGGCSHSHGHSHSHAHSHKHQHDHQSIHEEGNNMNGEANGVFKDHLKETGRAHDDNKDPWHSPYNPLPEGSDHMHKGDHHHHHHDRHHPRHNRHHPHHDHHDHHHYNHEHDHLDTCQDHSHEHHHDDDCHPHSPFAHGGDEHIQHNDSDHQEVIMKVDGHHYHEHVHDDHSHSSHNEGFGLGHDVTDHNMHGIFLHVLADTLGSVGVVISTLLIREKGWLLTDPACSIFISVLIISSVIPLLKHSSEVILQRVPRPLEAAIKKGLDLTLQVEGVVGFHGEHFWSFTPKVSVGTIRVQVTAGENKQRVLRKTLAIFKSLGITQMTLQVEDSPLYGLSR